MAVNGITALVFGWLFDRFGVRVLAVGIGISLLALPFGFLGGLAGAIAAAACWATGLGAQDASLRGGIAQVVSMNKRGSAFGAFNGIYGVAWFLGSVIMGALYDYSILALVTFGVVLQAVAGPPVFLRRRVAPEGRGSAVEFKITVMIPFFSRNGSAQPLGPLEVEVMGIVWDRGECAVRDVMEVLVASPGLHHGHDHASPCLRRESSSGARTIGRFCIILGRPAADGYKRAGEFMAGSTRPASREVLISFLVGLRRGG